MAVVVGLALYVIPVGGLILSYLSTTMRYQTDYSVGLAVLALVGLLALERFAQAAGRGWARVVVAVASVAAAVTVFVGVTVRVIVTVGVRVIVRVIVTVGVIVRVRVMVFVGVMVRVRVIVLVRSRGAAST